MSQNVQSLDMATHFELTRFVSLLVRGLLNMYLWEHGGWQAFIRAHNFTDGSLPPGVAFSDCGAGVLGSGNMYLQDPQSFGLWARKWLKSDYDMLELELTLKLTEGTND